MLRLLIELYCSHPKVIHCECTLAPIWLHNDTEPGSTSLQGDLASFCWSPLCQHPCWATQRANSKEWGGCVISHSLSELNLCPSLNSFRLPNSACGSQSQVSPFLVFENYKAQLFKMKWFSENSWALFFCFLFKQDSNKDSRGFLVHLFQTNTHFVGLGLSTVAEQCIDSHLLQCPQNYSAKVKCNKGTCHPVQRWGWFMYSIIYKNIFDDSSWPQEWMHKCIKCDLGPANPAFYILASFWVVVVSRAIA